MSKVLIHESGRKTIIAGESNVRVDVTDKDGRTDKVEKVIEVNSLSREELANHLSDPQNFNVVRYGNREIKDHEYRE